MLLWHEELQNQVGFGYYQLFSAYTGKWYNEVLKASIAAVYNGDEVEISKFVGSLASYTYVDCKNAIEWTN